MCEEREGIEFLKSATYFRLEVKEASVAVPAVLFTNSSHNVFSDLLFCGPECVTGPFSASQEIPHSAKVMAGKKHTELTA